MDETRFAALDALTERSTTVTKNGFSVNLAAEPEEWDRCLRALGRSAGYFRMAERLSALYEAQFGEPYLFSEDCMAWELQYHADAYLDALGYRGHSPHFSTLFFSKEELIAHTKEIDISVKDVNDPKQVIMFRYRQGIRPCWRGTDKDPFK